MGSITTAGASNWREVFEGHPGLAVTPENYELLLAATDTDGPGTPSNSDLAEAEPVAVPEPEPVVVPDPTPEPEPDSTPPPSSPESSEAPSDPEPEPELRRAPVADEPEAAGG